MAEGIVYLDADDEITSAAQRIRSAAGTRVALVVPYGSRIATARMNFRLLSREAVMNNRRLSIVSGDAAVRSLAASAGLPVFGTVGEYESAMASPTADSGDATAGAGSGADPGSGAVRESSVASDPPHVGAAAAVTGAAAMGAAAAASPLAASETVAAIGPADAPAKRKSQRPKRPVSATEATVVPAPDLWSARPVERPITVAEADGDPETPARLPSILGGRIRAPVVAAIGLIVLAVIVAGVGAYLFLPSASITLVPRREPIPVIELTISADPDAPDVDPANMTVPAVRVDVPVEASRTFTTTGVHVEETTARGSVTFTNYDTSSGVSIPSGSIVSTEGGTRFRTAATVTLQPAGIIPFQPRSDSVNVAAVKAGEGGNVPANTIRVVPQGQNPDLLRVNNPNPTGGGTHKETPEVKQAEVDKAMAALQVDLDAAFAAAISAGASAPADTKVFPETAVPGKATPDIDPKSLVGTAVATFDLRLTAKGTVIAVDPRPVTTIAEAQLSSRVAKDHRLVEGSAVIEVGNGTVGEDGQVTFIATARATQVAIVDPASLPGLVKGRTAAEAKAALVPFGDATVTLWPDWVSTVTSVDARLSIVVDEGSGGNPTPSTRPSARPSTRPSTSPPPSGAPTGSGVASPSGTSSSAP